MKRFKTIISYTLYTLLGTVFLYSCTGVETPNFNDKPFVVGSVERYNDSLCIYTATKFTEKFSELFAGKQRFIAKEKLFQVGDTVRISK